ncbi:MAG TPA: SDR family NAD(P)-dependent oxidoreductase, partial [Actinomycetes bacterium]
VARSDESLRRAEEQCRAAGAAGTAVVVADVGDESAVDAVARTAVTRFGRVDVWVHSAAVIAYGRFEDVPSHVFRRVLDTNVHGTVHAARTALRQFRLQGEGTLVLVGSLLGEIATPFMGSYVTGKWAVRGLGRVLSIETRDAKDIHVCVVSPGAVDTPVYDQAGSYTGRVGRPPPPVDRPEKVARAIVRCADHPRARVTVGAANRLSRLGFATLPGAFDVLVTPLMTVGALSRRETAPHEGNVFAPQPDGDALHGRWGRHWLRAVAVGAGAVAAAGWAVRARR